MRDAVAIVEAVRTPVGKRNGGLSGVHPADLSAHVLRNLVELAQVDPALIDDVIWGVVGQVGEQSFNFARTALLSAGWPESVPGTTVDRQCGSSQQSVHFAAAGLIAGQYDLGWSPVASRACPGCRWVPAARCSAARSAARATPWHLHLVTRPETPPSPTRMGHQTLRWQTQ